MFDELVEQEKARLDIASKQRVKDNKMTLGMHKIVKIEKTVQRLYNESKEIEGGQTIIKLNNAALEADKR